MSRPPLRQVAELAGVSEPTVSRVLNGRIGVATATRQRVIDALSTLGFDAVPPQRRNHENVIGIASGDFDNPVFPTFVATMAGLLARKGYLTMIAVSDEDLATEQRYVDEWISCDIGGAVFIGGNQAIVDGSLANYNRLVDAGIPVAFLNGIDTGLPAPHIWCDEGVGARKAIDHLVSLGHSRIGCVLGPSRYIPTTRFIAGYHEAMAAHGLTADDDAIVAAPFTLEGGRAGATRLIRRGITAVITGNDLMALGALAAAKTAGVESTFSAVGYDGTDFSSLTSPALTTLRQPFQEMADLLVDTLTDQIENVSPAHEAYVFEPDLVVRNSTHALVTTFA